MILLLLLLMLDQMLSNRRFGPGAGSLLHEVLLELRLRLTGNFHPHVALDILVHRSGLTCIARVKEFIVTVNPMQLALLRSVD